MSQVRRQCHCPLASLFVALGVWSIIQYGLPVASANAENWPGWRGTSRNGTSTETGLPERWSAEHGVRWKTRLSGYGTSSPVIWGEHVFLTAADGMDQSDLHIFCFALRDGIQQWHLRLWGTAPMLHHGSKSDMATPTPVTDGERLYALFGTGDVVCCDRLGKLIWHRSLAAEYGAFENRFGHTSSPLLHQNTLVVQCDHYGESYVLAIDTRTGRDCWRVLRPGTWHSWSSPQLVEGTTAADAEVIVCASERVDALRILDGSGLWTVRGLQRECIPTPVIGHGLVYAVSGPKGKTLAIRPGGSGDVTESRVVWSTHRGSPFVPSPVLWADNYYLVDDRGIATCLDAHTGKVHWQKRLPGAFTASPIAGDGKIYFTNESGETIVVEGGASYRELGRNSLSEPVYASCAMSQGCLFVRTPQHLYCIDGR